MKKRLVILLAAILSCCSMLSSCGTEDGASHAVSMPTPIVTDPVEYTPPAETLATWSEFDVDTSWKETDPLIHLSEDNKQTQWKGAKLYGKDLFIKELYQDDIISIENIYTKQSFLMLQKNAEGKMEWVDVLVD